MATASRRSRGDIRRALMAHFDAHPEHLIGGRENGPQLQHVVAATGLPSSTVSEWLKRTRNTNESYQQFHDRYVAARKPAIAVIAQAQREQAQQAQLPFEQQVANMQAQASVSSSTSVTPPQRQDTIMPDTASPVFTLDASTIQALQQQLGGVQSSIDQLKTRAERAEQEAANSKQSQQLAEAQLIEAQSALAAAELANQALLAKSNVQAPVRTEAHDDGLHIPKLADWHIPQPIDEEIAWNLKRGYDLLITGPTGAGKTQPVTQQCAVAKRPMRRVCFDGETTSQDLIGRRDANNGQTTWTDGVLPEAMINGQVLLVDEIDRADESSRAALFQVLDSRTLYLPVPNKRIVAAPGFMLIACCNSVGDSTGKYTGTQPVDAAFLSRWRDVCRVDYPQPDQEAKMINAYAPGIRKTAVDKITQFFQVLRKACDDGNLEGPFSIRQSTWLAHLFQGFQADGMGPKDALVRATERTLTNRTSQDNRTTIQETYQRIFGEECKR